MAGLPLSFSVHKSPSFAELAVRPETSSNVLFFSSASFFGAKKTEESAGADFFEKQPVSNKQNSITVQIRIVIAKIPAKIKHF